MTFDFQSLALLSDALSRVANDIVTNWEILLKMLLVVIIRMFLSQNYHAWVVAISRNLRDRDRL